MFHSNLFGKLNIFFVDLTKFILAILNFIEVDEFFFCGEIKDCLSLQRYNSGVGEEFVVCIFDFKSVVQLYIGGDLAIGSELKDFQIGLP